MKFESSDDAFHFAYSFTISLAIVSVCQIFPLVFVFKNVCLDFENYQESIRNNYGIIYKTSGKAVEIVNYIAYFFSSLNWLFYLPTIFMPILKKLKECCKKKENLEREIEIPQLDKSSISFDFDAQNMTDR